MKNDKISLIGLFLSLCFGIIVCTILFVAFNIILQPFFEIKLIFTAINLCILIAVATGGSALCSKITVPMFSAVMTATVLYTLVQFIFLGVLFASPLFSFYLIFQMILLFVYLLIVLPIIKTGYNINQKKQNEENLKEFKNYGRK